MSTVARKTRRQMINELERDRSNEIGRATIVRKALTQPVAFRASAPLLEALDRAAQAEHRTRGNLIQHVLWQYIHARKDPKR